MPKQKKNNYIYGRRFGPNPSSVLRFEWDTPSEKWTITGSTLKPGSHYRRNNERKHKRKHNN